MNTAQRVSRGFHRLGLVVAGAFFIHGMLGGQASADNFPFVGNQLYAWCRMVDTDEDESVKMVSKGLCAGYWVNSCILASAGRGDVGPGRSGFG